MEVIQNRKDKSEVRIQVCRTSGVLGRAGAAEQGGISGKFYKLKAVCLDKIWTLVIRRTGKGRELENKSYWGMNAHLGR